MVFLNDQRSDVLILYEEVSTEQRRVREHAVRREGGLKPDDELIEEGVLLTKEHVVGSKAEDLLTMECALDVASEFTQAEIGREEGIENQRGQLVAIHRRIRGQAKVAQRTTHQHLRRREVIEQGLQIRAVKT